MTDVREWAVAFVFTCVIEVPIYTLLLRRWCRWPVGLLLAIGVNLLTHPLLWILLAGGWLVDLVGSGTGWLAVMIGAEIAVWLVEASVLNWVLRRLARSGTDGAGSGRRPPVFADVALIAALANLCSLAAGFVLWLF
ncbi:hypothetical protein GIS00_10070 [Nakamurella sp. YIM 132087]|uniref:Uncharacterized protein n=1 Tax=Nakamurella alba TaxID=2665158 RepID=A0A7K1FM22_9ACTN|nr:hypothetical protein [Nakamurella alba]MTD14293.1 hypothetical protein [Nakamurella alba]